MAHPPSPSLTAIPAGSGHFEKNLVDLEASFVAMPPQFFDCVRTFKQFKLTTFVADNYQVSGGRCRNVRIVRGYPLCFAG